MQKLAYYFSPRLVLRQPTQADFASFFAIYSDPQTNLFNPFGPADLARSKENFTAHLHHWQQSGYGLWSIAAAANPDETIGFGGLSSYRYGAATKLNLGYRFTPTAWGNGYATELAKTAILVAFTALRKNEIFALVRPQNHPSIAVLKKSGMQAVGLLDDVPPQQPSLVYRITVN